MVAIYAKKSDRCARSVRATLLQQGIPCILIGPEYGHSSVMMRVPFVLFGEECEEIAAGFHKTLPAARVLPSYEMLRADALVQRLSAVYSIDYLNMSHGGIRFVNDVFYFYGNRIMLTDHETCIVKLLTLCHGNDFTADEVAAFCLDGGSAKAAAVHICHINAKNKASVTDRIIYSKRYLGYRVP